MKGSDLLVAALENEGVDRVFGVDPYAGLLVSMHWTGLYRARWGMQSGNTRQFIFDIPAIVAAISEFVPLAPGDVVLTGTPSGVGYRRDPKVLLRDGDRMVDDISRVGRLENAVRAEG